MNGSNHKFLLNRAHNDCDRAILKAYTAIRELKETLSTSMLSDGEIRDLQVKASLLDASLSEVLIRRSLKAQFEKISAKEVATEVTEASSDT